MYQYFTACDLNYAWWAIHLSSSMSKNSPSSSFTIFLITSEEESSERKKEIEGVFNEANPSSRIVWWNNPELEKNEIPRYCAGFRTYIFGPNRSDYFSEEDTLVWIDADSLVRKDLKSLELFCKENEFDTSARPKNKKDKFASGLIVQKQTSEGLLFGHQWHEKWKERFYNEEWTADQNSFNDTVSSNHSKNISKTIGLPREFCDVWITEEGVIWQAKHQTKMKKTYSDEMKKYRPTIQNSLFWQDIEKSAIKASIDVVNFTYKDVEFEFMGLEGELAFEEIKRKKSFLNLEFLEALSGIGNTDAMIDIGAGIQNNGVYLAQFTSPIISISIEPNIKMIDIGLRNAQNNPGLTKPSLILGTHTNFYGAVVNDLGQSVKMDVSSIGNFNDSTVQREVQRVPQILSVPNDLDYASNQYLRCEKFKTMNYIKYEFETWETIRKKEEYVEKSTFNPSEFQNSYMQSLDFLCKSIHTSLPSIRQLSQINYNYDKCIGMVVVDVFDSSLEILESGVNAINFFKPHVGVVVYNKRDKDERIDKIEKFLGPNYKNIYRGPNQLDSEATCLVYQSLGRKHE